MGEDVVVLLDRIIGKFGMTRKYSTHLFKNRYILIDQVNKKNLASKLSIDVDYS